MSFCLESYFKRIHYHGPRSVTLDTLRQVHYAHTHAIAFENLDAVLGRRIKIDDDSIFTKLVSAGRGGWCFEQNGLLRRVLNELGFNVTNLSGRVLLGDPDRMPGRTHRITLINLDASLWIADVGFGGKTLPVPMRLREGEVMDTVYGCYRLERKDGLWLLTYLDSEKTLKLYCFNLESQYDSDYEMGNHYVATWPESHFRHSLTLSLYQSEGRKTTLYSAAEGIPAFSQPDAFYRYLQTAFNLRFDHPLHGIEQAEFTAMLERLNIDTGK